VRLVVDSLFWASSAKQKALTNLVNDGVVGVIMRDNFSDISDEEVVSATQLIEELDGDDMMLIWCSLEKSHPGMVYLNKYVF